VQANTTRLISQDYVVFCNASGLGKEANPRDILRTINIFHHVFEALGLCCRNSETSPAGALPLFYKFLYFLGQTNVLWAGSSLIT